MSLVSIHINYKIYQGHHRLFPLIDVLNKTSESPFIWLAEDVLHSPERELRFQNMEPKPQNPPSSTSLGQRWLHCSFEAPENKLRNNWCPCVSSTFDKSRLPTMYKVGYTYHLHLQIVINKVILNESFILIEYSDTSSHSHC
jgi:hypothetical protein